LKNIENYFIGNSEVFFFLILKNMIVMAKLLKYITISYPELLAAEVCFKNNSPIPRLDGLSYKSKLLKIPEPAAPHVSSSSVSQELNKTLISH